jgi:hypothetical protein
MSLVDEQHHEVSRLLSNYEGSGKTNVAGLFYNCVWWRTNTTGPANAIFGNLDQTVTVSGSIFYHQRTASGPVAGGDSDGQFFWGEQGDLINLSTVQMVTGMKAA